jgi:hypothetical protein
MNDDNSWAKRFSAYGALFVTVVVFILLGMGLLFSYWSKTEPNVSFTNLMETIKTLAVLAAGYWVGSSNSSQKKDETIAKGSSPVATLPPGTKTVVTTPETVTIKTEPEKE